MEPFTALGLAAAIVQFIDFGSRLINTTREISVSAKGVTKEHETLDDICSHIYTLVDELDGAADGAGTSQQKIQDEVALRQLSDKCRYTALELQNLIKSLYRTPGGTIANFRQALRATCGLKKVSEMENRLKQFREQLIVHLVAITSKEQSSVLRELQQFKETSRSMNLNQSAKLNEITKAINEMKFQASLNRESCSQQHDTVRRKFADLSDMLLDAAENARRVSIQQMVLRGLYFKSMQVRHQTIAKAHEKTFRWILEHQINKETEELTHASTFAQWLETGNGIYWISGKAGSGKSTLMKLLTDHPRTADLLSTWSHPVECVTACHFFWCSGTRLQKSLDGLLRSLLFEIFRKVPELIAKVEELGLIDDSNAGFAPVDEGRPWSMQELAQVVDRLATCNDIPMRFCFFIDGLDEYGGHHREVIKILGQLASSANIKICVSSRPWNVFEDAYGGSTPWKLSLQDLTRDDILYYTEGMLQTHPNWEEYSAAGGTLVREITDKAQGVFLWVFLVVRSINEGLTNGDSVTTLRRRINKLPQDLEAFFKHMLNAIDPFYHREMAQTFKTALQAEEPLSLMIYSLMDQCLDDDNLALSSLIAPMDNHDIFARRRQMRRRLDGRCKGLLEIQADRSAIDYLGPRINFLHRTVRDFFLTKEMADFLDGLTPDFKPTLAIFRAYVALVKSMPVKKHHFHKSGVLSQIVADAFFYAHQTDQELGYLEPELVDELRYTVEEMAALFDAETPWELNCFIEFSISKGLSCYLAQQPECRQGAEAVIDGTFLREALMETTKPNSDGSPDMTKVISLFLRRGSNPNRGIRRVTRQARTVRRNWSTWIWTDPGNSATAKTSIKIPIWIEWLGESCSVISGSEVSYTWAMRQQRILELLVSHGADVNGNPDLMGDFVEALFQSSAHEPSQRLYAIYIDMLKTLLQHGGDPNAPYHNATICKAFFTKLRKANFRKHMTAFKPNVPRGLARLKLLAQVAEALLRHGAHPSCVRGISELDAMFPPRLAEPLRELWKARYAETRSSITKVVVDWLWWPWTEG
ncbi:hypothetical protein ACHAPT_006107 [Fusarium lateritium]